MLSRIGKTLVVILSVLLTACGSIYHKFTIDEPPATSLSIDARQRVILVTNKGGPTENERGEPVARRRVVCAEPSPDAFSALAAYAGFSLGPKDNPNASSADAGYAETVEAIARRTATTQLLRDGLFRACEAYMNGVIGRAEYRQIIMAYDEILITLVALEGLGRPMIDRDRPIGGQNPKDMKDSNQARKGNTKEDIVPAPSGNPDGKHVPPTLKQEGANNQGPAGQATAANQGKRDLQGTENQGSAPPLSRSMSLEPYAADKIHRIVRDYYCFQLALKKMFYEDQPRFKMMENNDSTAGQKKDERQLERTGKYDRPREGHVGYLPYSALKFMCSDNSVPPPAATSKPK